MDLIPFNESFLSLTIKASLIAILAFSFSFSLKRKNASLRSQIWSFAGIMLLVFPIASFFLPSWELSFLEPQKVVLGDAVEQTSSFNYLLMIWLFGFSVILTRLVVNLVRLNQLQKSCKPVNNLKWLDISNQIARKLKIKRKITLLESDQISMPMTWGFFKPYVLLPANSDRWNVKRRKMVLMHEFEHIYRCDWLIQIASSLAIAIHWFNPFSWLVSFMIKLEREKACDDAVLRLGASPADYASTLLMFAKHKRESTTMGLTCALQLITGSQLQSRIQSILNNGVGRTRLSKTVGFALSLSVLLCVLPIASAHSPIEMVKAVECFPEEEYVASEINIQITPVNYIKPTQGKAAPVNNKGEKKSCQKHKCNKSKKGQPNKTTGFKKPDSLKV